MLAPLLGNADLELIQTTYRAPKMKRKIWANNCDASDKLTNEYEAIANDPIITEFKQQT